MNIGGPAPPPSQVQSDDIVIMKRITIIAHKKKTVKGMARYATTAAAC